jgi:hypothetical protein
MLFDDTDKQDAETLRASVVATCQRITRGLARSSAAN